SVARLERPQRQAAYRDVRQYRPHRYVPGVLEQRGRPRDHPYWAEPVRDPNARDTPGMGGKHLVRSGARNHAHRTLEAAPDGHAADSGDGGDVQPEGRWGGVYLPAALTWAWGWRRLTPLPPLHEKRVERGRKRRVE